MTGGSEVDGLDKRSRLKQESISGCFAAIEQIDEKVGLVEIFRSICGEGLEAGDLALFIRVAGCNLRCEYPCDTVYAYEPRMQMSLVDLYDVIVGTPTTRLFWTGGECTLRDDLLEPLFHRLAYEGYIQVIQSNGTRASCLFQYCDLISLDYKGPSAGLPQNASSKEVIHSTISDYGWYIPIQIKFLIKDEEDHTFARQRVEELSKLESFDQIKIILGTVGGVEMTPLIDRIKQEDYWWSFSNIKVLPQIHKLIWGPNKRGV